MNEPTTTQQKHPGRATARTLAQQVIGFVLAAGVVLPVTLVIVDEELGAVIPEKVRGSVVAVVGVAVAVSTTVARIMAIPKVDAWLGRHGITRGLASSPDA